MKKYFSDEVDSTTEELSAAVGEFYKNTDNASVFQPRKAPKHDNEFGNVDDGDKDNDEVIGVPALSEEGLKDNAWNHIIPSLLVDTTPSQRVTGRDHFKKKFDAARAKMRADAQRNMRQGKEFQPEHLFPYTLDPSSDEGKEELAPYSLADGKLKKPFVSAINWLLVECPATRMKSQRPEIIMPINIDMTLEGVGGIYPGNMFRLAYLPEAYGQVNFIDGGSPSDTPTTYFSMMGVTHTINQEGWQTKVAAVTNKHVKETEVAEEAKLKDRERVLSAYEEYMRPWTSKIPIVEFVPEPETPTGGRLKGKEAYLPGPWDNEEGFEGEEEDFN
jgi:hypothetical protein